MRWPGASQCESICTTGRCSLLIPVMPALHAADFLLCARLCFVELHAQCADCRANAAACMQELHDPLHAAGILVHKIGGADYAAELDAKRAIDQVGPVCVCLRHHRPALCVIAASFLAHRSIKSQFAVTCHNSQGLVTIRNDLSQFAVTCHNSQ